MDTQSHIPFFFPSISDPEIEEVVAVLRSGWLTTGARAHELERRFAEYVGAPYAQAVNSCTAGLHLALVALGIGPGDEVVLPTMTFAATGEVVIHAGAHPVLADCDPDTLLLDPRSLERCLGPATRAVMPVHLGGQPCDMRAIEEIARGAGVAIVEDAAHALPATDAGRMVGTIGDATVFSFYANKTITTAEGGMVTTGNAQLAERLQVLSLHGMDRDAWKRFRSDGTWDYAVVEAGFKYNLPDVLAAIGLRQLDRVDELWAERGSLAQRYARALAGIPEVSPLEVRPDVSHAWHLFVVRLDVERLTIDRAEFIRLLGEAGIGASVHYRPLHLHPLYRDRFGYRPQDLPAATAVFPSLVSLPLYPGMGDDAIDRVVEVIADLVRRHRK